MVNRVSTFGDFVRVASAGRSAKTAKYIARLVSQVRLGWAVLCVLYTFLAIVAGAGQRSVKELMAASPPVHGGISAGALVEKIDRASDLHI